MVEVPAPNTTVPKPKMLPPGLCEPLRTSSNEGRNTPAHGDGEAQDVALGQWKESGTFSQYLR